MFVGEWQQRLGREVEQGSERYGDDRANKAYDVVRHTEIWCRKRHQESLGVESDHNGTRRKNLGKKQKKITLHTVLAKNTALRCIG